MIKFKLKKEDLQLFLMMKVCAEKELIREKNQLEQSLQKSYTFSFDGDNMLSHVRTSENMNSNTNQESEDYKNIKNKLKSNYYIRYIIDKIYKDEEVEEDIFDKYASILSP